MSEWLLGSGLSSKMSSHQAIDSNFLMSTQSTTRSRKSICSLSIKPHKSRVSQDSADDSSKIVRKNFRFDKIIDSQYSQEEVFEQLQIKGLITKVMDGFHATIFAYG